MNVSIAADIVKDIRNSNRKLNGTKKYNKYNPRTCGIIDAEYRFYNEAVDWTLLSPDNVRILCGIEVDICMDVAYFNDDSVAMYRPAWNSDYSNIHGNVVISPKYRDAVKYFMEYGEVVQSYEV